MEKQLIITEKESVARDIAAVLKGFSQTDGGYESDAYVLVWAVGHILTLPTPEEIDPKYKRWALEDLPILPERFEMKPLKGMEKRIKMIAKQLKRKDVAGVINACDAGREGELIFREIVEYAKSEKPIKRLWLQSMTPSAIREGFEQLQAGEKYNGLAAAAWSRSEADWLVGMNSTRAITRRLKSRSSTGAWSAGRVQTPTLAIVVNHEFRILNSEIRPYWQIVGHFQAQDHVYQGTWFDPQWKGDPELGEKEDRLFDQAYAEQLVQQLTGQTASAEEKRKPIRESAPQLFDLTTLQREANRRYRFSARRTLQAAQRLYEGHKALTYPRTDSRCLPEDYQDHVKKVFQNFQNDAQVGPYAQHLLNNPWNNIGRIFDNSKVSDHFAIIPTGEIPKGLTGDDERIFNLVMNRFLAAFYPPAVWSEVERLTSVQQHRFRTRSRTLVEKGWREVCGVEEQEEDAKLPALVPGQDQSSGVGVNVDHLELKENETKPPSRLTEGRLLGLMERAGKDLEDEELSEAMRGKGLGTPATRADTIENLVTKGYIQRARGMLRATAKGIRLIDFLHRIDTAGLTSAELTGDWEKKLQEVEEGQLARTEFMNGINDFTCDIVGKIKDFEYEDLYAKEAPVGTCPVHPESPVVEFFWGYRCSYNDKSKSAAPPPKECDFIIWKEILGRYIDRKTAQRLLAERVTPPLVGFMDQSGREFRAALVLKDDNTVEVQGQDVVAQSDEPEKIEGTVLGPCPCGEDCEVVETNLRYACRKMVENPGKKPKDIQSCGFVLPKLVCKREMSREEAEEYLKNGRTQMLEGFISKRGRPFPAVLYRKDNGRHGFEFAPREPRGGAKSKTSTTKRATTKRSTTKKTTTRKTRSTKEATE